MGNRGNKLEISYKEYFGYVGLDAGISVSISLVLRLMLLAWSLIGLPLYLLHRPSKPVCRPGTGRQKEVT